MTTSLKETGNDLKETMDMMIMSFQEVLKEKNCRLAEMEQALMAEQQMTIEANQQISQLKEVLKRGSSTSEKIGFSNR
ncbi:hypothetical protein I6N95_24775 [Vagococcus sp. BWB3-3]|uniref:Uncharacterized protein n=1 Tax=Vagococcus allomyrinae TaxID=2794353 RepID=A0A940PJW4_9ENTE|nr:hypothetical protein [Vagococcus allomyrinae]MBP1044228.1 hypothetical protein [Vagococcus allomyrinae]